MDDSATGASTDIDPTPEVTPVAPTTKLPEDWKWAEDLGFPYSQPSVRFPLANAFLELHDWFQRDKYAEKQDNYPPPWETVVILHWLRDLQSEFEIPPGDRPRGPLPGSKWSIHPTLAELCRSSDLSHRISLRPATDDFDETFASSKPSDSNELFFERHFTQSSTVRLSDPRTLAQRPWRWQKLALRLRYGKYEVISQSRTEELPIPKKETTFVARWIECRTDSPQKVLPGHVRNDRLARLYNIYKYHDPSPVPPRPFRGSVGFDLANDLEFVLMAPHSGLPIHGSEDLFADRPTEYSLRTDKTVRTRAFMADVIIGAILASPRARIESGKDTRDARIESDQDFTALCRQRLLHLGRELYMLKALFEQRNQELIANGLPHVPPDSDDASDGCPGFTTGSNTRPMEEMRLSYNLPSKLRNSVMRPKKAYLVPVGNLGKQYTYNVAFGNTPRDVFPPLVLPALEKTLSSYPSNRDAYSFVCRVKEDSWHSWDQMLTMLGFLISRINAQVKKVKLTIPLGYTEEEAREMFAQMSQNAPVQPQHGAMPMNVDQPEVHTRSRDTRTFYDPDRPIS